VLGTTAAGARAIAHLRAGEKRKGDDVGLLALLCFGMKLGYKNFGLYG